MHLNEAYARAAFPNISKEQRTELVQSGQRQLFKYGEATYRQYAMAYKGEGWEGRKVVALLMIIPGALKTIYSFGVALIFSLPHILLDQTDKFNTHFYHATRELQEYNGWVITLFNDMLGTFLVAEARFQKQCYEDFFAPKPPKKFQFSKSAPMPPNNNSNVSRSSNVSPQAGVSSLPNARIVSEPVNANSSAFKPAAPAPQFVAVPKTVKKEIKDPLKEKFEVLVSEANLSRSKELFAALDYNGIMENVNIYGWQCVQLMSDAQFEKLVNRSSPLKMSLMTDATRADFIKNLDVNRMNEPLFNILFKLENQKPVYEFLSKEQKIALLAKFEYFIKVLEGKDYGLIEASKLTQNQINLLFPTSDYQIIHLQSIERQKSGRLKAGLTPEKATQYMIHAIQISNRARAKGLTKEQRNEIKDKLTYDNQQLFEEIECAVELSKSASLPGAAPKMVKSMKLSKSAII